MRYWLTTHYRHQSPSHPYSIYLKNGYRQRSKRIDVGDGVAFSELKGKTRGRQTIVAMAEVSGEIRKNVHRDGGPDIGEQIWEWEIPCTVADEKGTLSKDRLSGIMEWDPDWSLRVRGGVVELEPAQFKRISEGFKKGA